MNRKAGRREGFGVWSEKTSRLPVFLWIAGSIACAAPTPTTPTTQKPVPTVADFVAVESRLIDRLAASDPRLALRFGITPSRATLSKIETEGVLAEDAKIALRGASLDPYAFAARARTLA